MLRELIKSCWAAEAIHRPSFSHILSVLEQVKRDGPPKLTLQNGVNAHKYVKKKVRRALWGYFGSATALELFDDMGMMTTRWESL